MQKTLRSKDHQRLLGLLVAARHAAGINQQQLARSLGRPQSFVAKYEGGERRIDVVEFVTIARALGADPIRLLASFVKDGKSKTSATGRAAPRKSKV
jgi:transcriptional regulator with XRE-family HTH domain